MANASILPVLWPALKTLINVAAIKDLGYTVYDRVPASPAPRVYLSRVSRQTRIGIYSNLWPTRESRRDRVTLGAWYLTLHLGTYRAEMCGPTRQQLTPVLFS